MPFSSCFLNNNIGKLSYIAKSELNMNLQELFRLELAEYLLNNPETANKAVLEEMLAGAMDIFARGPSLAHVTASGWILNHEGNAALLIEHAKYLKFCPPGGHVDPGETALAACLREVMEETGLKSLTVLSTLIFDLDIHWIPASDAKNEPAHWHLDVRYALQAGADSLVALNLDECLSHKWVPLIELATGSDQSLRRLAKKTQSASWIGCKKAHFY